MWFVDVFFLLKITPPKVAIKRCQVTRFGQFSFKSLILLGIFSAIVYCIILMRVNFIFFKFIVSSTFRNLSKVLI